MIVFSIDDILCLIDGIINYINEKLFGYDVFFFYKIFDVDKILNDGVLSCMYENLFIGNVFFEDIDLVIIQEDVVCVLEDEFFFQGVVYLELNDRIRIVKVNGLDF